jgi:hypothetical protein
VISLKLAFCKNALRILGVVTALFLLMPDISPCAPYGVQNKNTVYDRLYETDLVIYGEISKKMKDKKEGSVTEIQVIKNIKGGTWKSGDYFYVNTLINQPLKTVGVLYVFRSDRQGEEFYEFGAFNPDKDNKVYDYTMRLKAYLDANDLKTRLTWLTRQVNSTNDFVAWDAYAQLGMASYENLKKVAPRFQKESLRYMIAQKKTSPARKSFYAFLLGLAGDPADGILAQRLIENPANKESEVVYGAMMAFGLLNKNYPRYFMERIMKGPTDNIRMAVLEAVGNLMTYERPYNEAPVVRPIYWAIEKGSLPVKAKAVRVAGDVRLLPVFKYMRELYFNKFLHYPDGKVAVITYLKFIRRESPDAVELLKVIKSAEKDPKLRNRI